MMKDTWNKLTTLGDRQIVQDIVLLFVRVGLAAIFWRSARTKVEEGSFLELTDTTFFLFQEEYAGVPLPPEFAAYAATYAEHFLPIMLVLGLGSRFAAAGLIVMTLVIQFFVYPDAWWSPHMGWVALGLVILTQGPGRIAIDNFIAGKKAS